MRALKILLIKFFMIIGIPLLLILAFVVPYRIHHYYEVSMVVPIEWVGVTEENYGKKISVEFLEMLHSYSHYPVKRNFVIGKTKNLVLPHSLFLFDPESVRPESIQLTLIKKRYKYYQNRYKKCVMK